jgi:GxxExxY protein
MKTNENSTTPSIVEPDLSYAIVGAFFRVYRALGWGLSEVHYKRALEIVLKEYGLEVDREYPVAVMFEDQQIGFQKLDLLVARRVIVEVKASEVMPTYATSQLRSYLAVSKLRLGILLHFGPKAVHHRVLGPKALG